MPLSRNAKRRIALYGCALAVLAALAAVRRLTVSHAPQLGIRAMDLEGAKRHEATGMLEELLRLDTSDPPGVTRPAVELLARAFACEGIPYEVVGDDPSHPLIAARLAGRETGEALLLLNHLDVVPPGKLSDWDVPPFAGEFGTGKNANYLYGRGSLDMKGQAVASFYAMADLKRNGIVPLRDIVFLGETGEETFRPEIGIGWVMDHRPDLLRGVRNVYNEGGVNETLGASVQRFGIEVMQKATVNLYVDARSKQELDALKKFLDARNEAEPYRTSPAILEYLQFIGPSRSDVWGRAMIQPSRVIESERFRREAPDAYQTLLRDRFYCGPPEPRAAGDWQMEVAWSLLPGSPVVEKRAELEGWLKERAMTSRPHIVTGDCIASPESGRGWEALVRVLGMDPVEKGAAVGSWVLTGSYTNSAWCRAHGLNAYGVSPFNVNIYDAEKIHHQNERILGPYFVEGVARMARIVREYATAP